MAKSIGRNDALLPILWGLIFNVLTQGRAAESLNWVQETRDTAKATGDPDLLITGHTMACVYYFFMGRLNEAVEQGDKVLALYDGEKHRHLVDLLNHDPKTLVGAYCSVCHVDEATRTGRSG